MANRTQKNRAASRKSPAKLKSNAIRVRVKNPDDKAEVDLAKAEKVLRPDVLGAFTVQSYGKSFGELDLQSLVNLLQAEAKAVNEGDLTRAEGMLMVQAHTLDAVFNNLAQRAINAQYMSDLDSFLRLALKAQSQCRATLETLAAIKNPMAGAYVRQANIAAGHQQVNNGRAEPSRSRENGNEQSKLLEASDGERLDTGTQGPAIGADTQLATVG